MLEIIIGFLTVGVSVFVAVSFLPAIQPQNAALLRWVRGSNVTVTVDELRPGDRYDTTGQRARPFTALPTITASLTRKSRRCSAW